MSQWVLAELVVLRDSSRSLR